MLSFARRTFNFEPEREISRLTFSSELSTGLRLVLDQYISNSTSSSNANTALGIVLQKPANTFKSISTPTSNDSSDLACFLNSCYLCKKKLKPEEDIYMYMGDQGFCSEECRTKQIAMDEMKEVEDALDRRMKSRGSVYVESDLPDCPNGGECETCRLLEDLRQRRRRRKVARR